jgi:hypothetical protein
MPSGIRTDPEILDLLILDLLAEGASPPEAAAAMVDRDVAWGRYESCGSELEMAFDDYQAQAERVLARAERMAKGLFRVNARGGGTERPRAAAMRESHRSRRVGPQQLTPSSHFDSSQTLSAEAQFPRPCAHQTVRQ